MKWGRDSVASAIEKDLQRPQLMLPFPDEKTIDTKRCCKILRVNRWTIYRLCVTPLKVGSPESCLKAYNTLRNSHLRIDYDSLTLFLDNLRAVHAIPDRRPPAAWGRHRDEDLLPFPWADTITFEHVVDVLNIHRSNVLSRIETGQFEAYQIAPYCPWRISRSSLAKYIAGFGTAPAGARPYGASKILQGEG